MKRQYPCPKCETGELYDIGNMFVKQIRCNNLNCDYEEEEDCYGIISGDIDD